jgi:hypothetical protein
MSPKASVLVLVAGLAALWLLPGTPKPPPAEPHLSSGHTHDNLTVFVLRGPDVLPDANILTLQEALDRNLAVVHETGSVNLLEVENLSADHQVFLQSGDIVKGGKQDRIVSKDLLVAAKSGRVPCPANCCEQSRWQPRGKEAAGNFEKSTDFAVGNPIKIANQAGSQGGVWKEVANTQAVLSQTLGKPVTANASPTSLQLALEDADLRAKVAGYERSLGGLATAYPDAVGVVVAVNGQVIASDVYGSRALFRKAWPKLLRSAAVDAVAQTPPAAVAAATREDAEAFLAKREESEVVANDVAITEDREIGQFWRRFWANDNPGEPVAITGGIDSPEPTRVQRQENLAGRSGETREVSNNSGGGTADVIGEVQQLVESPRELAKVGMPPPNLNPTNPTPNAGPQNLLRPFVDNTMQSYQLGLRVDLPVGQTVGTPPSPGVVTFESRAGAQGNALVHRGKLKK